MKCLKNPLGAEFPVRKPEGLSSAGHKEAVRLTKPFAMAGKGKSAYRVLSKQIAAMEKILAQGSKPKP